MNKNRRLIFAFLATFIIGATAGWGIPKLFSKKEPTFQFEINTELGGYTLTKVEPYENESIVIPYQYNGDLVTEIGRSALSGCRRIESVTIPATVKEIDYRAFFKCVNLTEIIIPKNVKKIGQMAFEDCNNLKKVILGESVSEIDESAFIKCSSLTEVIIPNNVEKIGRTAFEDCNNLKKVVLGESVSEIGLYAFNKCYSLTEFCVDEKNGRFVAVDGNLYEIDEETKAKSLLRYAIGKPETTFSVPDWCSQTLSGSFSDSNLTAITLPTSLKVALGFNSCKKLTSIAIPENVTSVGSFIDCTSLKDVSLPMGLTHLPSFYNCESLESITIPSLVKEIAQKTFYNCSSLKSITIPELVLTIGEHAFWGCKNLTSVVFENSAYWTATHRIYDDDEIEFEKTEIADPQTAAQYLVTDYSEYTWKQ